ncbi:HdeD family acid-resistance protein [Ktedonospora formicarum]|uniref:HdeD family acid-resistance protein n=1 Tax=Ktedonospora formicarum TaxID=2778364 RepID=A0A8J3MPU4_9CHLR|nr:DUF308 domain-containing protein [Ktedonospora formicarum]GHO42116.1 hypothetical protein KSX_02790 [Ktedonospora formicarum]
MRPRFPSIMETAASNTSAWWLVVIAGIAAVVVGVLLLISPGTTLLVLVQFLGAYWLVTGVLAFANLCIDRRLWGWKLVTGILGVIAGLSVLRNPLWSAIFVPKLLVIFLAIDAFVMGMTQNIHAFRGGSFSLAILGIMNVLFAIILLLNPVIGVFLLPIVLGMIGIIGGGLAALRAFASRPRQTPLQPPGAQPV